MKTTTLTTSFVSALLLAGTASASFNGVSLELHTQWEGYNVMRLYANVSGPGAGVNYWGGNDSIGFDMFISNVKSDYSPGSGFWQTEFASGLLPQASGPLYDAFAAEFDHSTYFTIGAEAGWGPGDVGPVFAQTPGFNPPVNGETTITGQGGVVTNPGSPNSLAVDGRVLLAQFTVLEGEYIIGEFQISYFDESGSGSEFVSFIWIPAPGALGLFAVAGLTGNRRRRD